MKKRRIVLASFLLIAVLVMAIGFAAVVNTLSITGTATFRPVSSVISTIDPMIHFDTTPGATVAGDYCVSATVLDDNDKADMNVIINDADGKNQFTAVATYTVVYEDDNGQHLPSVKLAVSADIAALGGGDVEGFDIDVKHEHIGEQKVAEMFSPGESMLITVYVTYDTTGLEDVSTDVFANISVALDYSTVDVGTVSN